MQFPNRTLLLKTPFSEGNWGKDVAGTDYGLAGKDCRIISTIKDHVPKMKILFIAYDNESFLTSFPLGIAYLASVLRGKGCEVSIYSQDVYHLPEDHLVNHLQKNHFDLVGVGVIGGYYQYRKLLKISQAINSIPNRRFFYVIGGHGPSPEPEFFLRKTGADAVVMGEGEVVIE